VTTQGITVLHFAAKAGNVDSITQLLDWGLDLNDPETGSQDRNPLHMAIEEQEENAVTLLLNRGADPNAVQQSGWRPLMQACKNGNLMICQALIKAGAKTEGKEKCSPQGWTALHIAAKGKLHS